MAENTCFFPLFPTIFPSNGHCLFTQTAANHILYLFIFLFPYLDGGVVAALLHMQQSAALAARPELDLQAAGAGRLGGGALQGPSQQDVPFGSLLQGVVQPAGAIQGQGGVCRGVCGGERKSSVSLCLTSPPFLRPIVKLIFPLWSGWMLGPQTIFPNRIAITTNWFVHSHQRLQISSHK